MTNGPTLDFLFDDVDDPKPQHPPWTFSQKGNPCRFVNGWLCTVFEYDAGFRYVLNQRGIDPIYSDTFETQKEAMQEAVEHAERLRA